MNAPPQVRLSVIALAVTPVLLVAPSVLFAAGAASVLDSGGKRVVSATYSMDGSLASLGGITAAASPQVVARHGYAGQLYDVQSLAISASAGTVNETGTSQLSAKANLDDSTFLSLAATSVVWSVASGPIASISISGLATASNVYQDTAATVRADYQSKVSTLPLTVLNVGNDDYGLYAQDGLDDAWQVRYFGVNNPQAGPDADPDGEGVSNYKEFIADTNPTNALSFFHILNIAHAAGFSVFFQSSADRKYTLYYATNLASSAWTNIPSQTEIPGSGGVGVLTDPSPAGRYRYYRVGVRLP